MAALLILSLLACIKIVQSVDIINVTEIELGELVSDSVSLLASSTYSVTSKIPQKTVSTLRCSACQYMFYNTIPAWTLQWCYEIQPYRVVSTIKGTYDNPVIFVVREQENVVKWTLPSNAERWATKCLGARIFGTIYTSRYMFLFIYLRKNVVLYTNILLVFC